VGGRQGVQGDLLGGGHAGRISARPVLR
jgi:hypothetical protein